MLKPDLAKKLINNDLFAFLNSIIYLINTL